MESAIAKLPQEIVNAVVEDYAIQTDPKALKALGLVSRVWAHPTREHLFRAITIEIPERLEALKLLLQGRPRLCQYIKSLNIDVDTFPDSLYTDAEFNSHMWTDHPIESLSLLTSLTHVAVGVGHRSASEWPKYLPYSLQAALHGLFARPHITSVSLSDIEIDLIPFTQYHHIEKLALHGVRVPAWSQACCFPMNRLPTKPRYLRALSLSLVSPVMWRVLSLCCASPEATLSLGKIKELTITTIGERPTAFETLTDEQWSTVFNTFGRSIESYTLRPSSFRQLSLAFTPLWSFPNLRQFTLEIMDEELSTNTQAMTSLAKALEERSESDKSIDLSSIQVKYLGCAQFIKLEFEDHGGLDFWTRLDGILGGDTCSSLKEVIFTFEVYCCKRYLEDKKDWDDFADLFHTKFFPKLSSRGILTLRCHIYPRSPRHVDPFFEPHVIKAFSR
jgi:hypothetical protein